MSMELKQLPSIRNLIGGIEKNLPQNSRELAAIVQRNQISCDELLRFTHFDHPKYESYGRRQLFENNTFCIYVMSWCAGDLIDFDNIESETLNDYYSLLHARVARARSFNIHH